MAHNLDMSNDRANIAFRGSRNDVWHKLGQEMQPGMSIEEWAKAAGLDWEAIKVPALADLTGLPFNGSTVDSGLYFNARSDTGKLISGALSDRHVNVQPKDVLAWFDRYISVDDRFSLDVAGSLKGGSIIWATATYNGAMTVAGDTHRARLLMSTTFDASGATINKGTMTRVVCNNTLDAALFDRSCQVKTRHNTRFDANKVSRELAQIAKGFDQYKVIGDAMAQVELSKDAVADFFKDLLDIARDAKPADISARKQNQYKDMATAYRRTVEQEGAAPMSAWACLNAVTRYVDHDRSTRNGDVSTEEARFTSAQFGSGAALKGKAMDLLMPRLKDRVPVSV